MVSHLKLSVLLLCIVGGGLIAAAGLSFNNRPDATLEVAFRSAERFKMRILINQHLASRHREKAEHRFDGSTNSRQIRIPLTAKLIDRVQVEVGPVMKDVPVSAKLEHIRLSTPEGRLLQEGTVTDTKWTHAEPLGLRRPNGWISGSATFGGSLVLLVGLVFFVRLAGRTRASHTLSILWLCTGLALSSSLFCSLIVWQRGPWLPAESWVNDITYEKRALAEVHPSPRLLTFGGSSGLYGLSTEYLSKVSGHSAVNLCTHAGLPLAYHLNLAKQTLRPGDDVLLQLEHAYLAGSSGINQWQVEQLNSWAWRGIAPELFGISFAEFAVNMPLDRLGAGVLARALLAESNRAKPWETRMTNGQWVWLYGPHHMTINDKGDLRIAYDPQGISKPTPIRYLSDSAFDPLHPKIKAIETFTRSVRKNHHRVFFVFPPIIASELADFSSPELMKWTDDFKTWAALIGLEVLGRPEHMAQSISQFFDTNYHLGASGRQDHTTRVMRLLEEAGWPSR